MSVDFDLVMRVDTGGAEPREFTLFESNFTYNLGPMWRLAGVCDVLYNADGKTAGDVVGVLSEGLARMESSPETFEALNPSNGWGSYDGAVSVLRKIVAACRDNPLAIVSISR